MAKQKNTGIDYGAERNKLKIHGPGRLYVLWGEEDYLRERFLDELKAICLRGGAEDFNYKRFDGRKTELRDLEEAVNSMPFMGERCFVEVRDYDINACKDAEQEKLKEILEDIPDYCTLVFVQDIGYVPDGRLGFIKAMKKTGAFLEFSAQGQTAIVRWIGRRFKELGKDISLKDAEYLIFTSGSLMNQLIPEIEKLSSYVEGNTVTRRDIDAVAIKLPEASVFEMTDCLTRRDYDGAARIMAELLRSRESPIKLIAIIGNQMRRLYAAKLVSPKGRGGTDELCALCGIRQAFAAERLIASARKFELKWLAFACELCAEYDYKMKSSGVDDSELLKELLARLAIGA
ncbi:MAG: DNA polymerase III subunit delta [Oscillospiraceae bacterium]